MTKNSISVLLLEHFKFLLIFFLGLDAFLSHAYLNELLSPFVN